MDQSEQEARKTIDHKLELADWVVCDPGEVDLLSHRGIAIREFPLKSGYGFADYLLYIDGRAAGVIEAKKTGVTLTGVETQSAKYTAGLPNGLPAWCKPLPFSYQSTGVETRFTNGLEADFEYDPNQLDRDVVAPDPIRTIIQTFRDELFTGIFPGRTEVPKTLIFAKDDAHAENIVEIVREEFGKGNEFAQKITYRTTGDTPQNLIKAFRNSYHPRIVVTVDMIATGTDIKPVEIVFFMRAVKSRSFFEQMKDRGMRIIKSDDLRAVTPDATVKDHFVIVDAVGVCEQDTIDARPMEKKPSVAFEKLLQGVAFGNTEDDVLTSVAGRLARMEHRITAEDEKRIVQASGGSKLRDLSHRLIEALNPDRQIEQRFSIVNEVQKEVETKCDPGSGCDSSRGTISRPAQVLRDYCG